MGVGNMADVALATLEPGDFPRIDIKAKNGEPFLREGTRKWQPHVTEPDNSYLQLCCFNLRE